MAEAILRLTADNSELDKGLDEAERKFERFSTRLTTIGDGMMKVGAGLLAQGIGMFGGLAYSAHGYVQEINRVREAMSQMGRDSEANVKQFEEQARVWEQQGFAVESLATAYARLSGNTASHQQTMMAMQAAVDMSAHSHFSLTESVLQVNNAMRGQYGEIINLVPELGTLEKHGDALSVIMQKFSGTAAATADPLDEMRVKMAQASREIGVQLLPVFDRLIALVSNAADRMSKLTDGQKQFAANTLLASIAIGGLLVAGGQALIWATQFRAVLIGIRSIYFAAVVGGWSKALLAFATGPVAVTIIALGTLIGLLYEAEAAQRKLLAAVGQAAPGGGSRVMNSGYVETGEGLETPAEIAQQDQAGWWTSMTGGAAEWIFSPSSYYQRLERNKRQLKESEHGLEQLARERERANRWREREATGNYQPMPAGSPFAPELPTNYETIASQLAGQTGLR